MKLWQFVSFYILFILFLGSNGWVPSAGRFELKILEFQRCEDEGTNEVKFGINLFKKNPQETVYRTNWTWPYTLDDNFQGRIEISKWGSTGWGKSMYNADCKNYCKCLKEKLPQFFNSFLSSMGLKPSCPVPAGTYSIQDWSTNLTHTLSFKVLPYGKYKVDTIFIRQGRRIGCWRFIVVCSQIAA